MHVVFGGPPRAVAGAARTGQGRARGERGGDYNPGQCLGVGACTSDGEARGYEESEGEKGVVDGRQRFSGGAFGAVSIVGRCTFGIDV